MREARWCWLAADCLPLDPDRYGEAGRLLLQAYPYRAHELASWQRPSTEESPDRWQLNSPGDGLMLAYAALWRVESTKYRFDLVVDPVHRRHGIGTNLLGIILDRAIGRGAVTLQARALADAPESLAFLDRRGFVETMRMRSYELASVATMSSELAIPDVRIASVETSQLADPEFWERLTALHHAAREDWPDPDPGGPLEPMSVGRLQSMLLPATGAPLAFCVATAGSQLAGYSVLVRRREADAQFVATAVRPDMRHRRIATALRARCLRIARDAGCRVVLSSSGSDALIHINKRFGFSETRCEVRFVRRVS